MPCLNCSSGPLSSFAVSYFYDNNPSLCGDNECGSNSLNAKCVYYAGPNLSCSGVNNLDSVELALQKMDEQICSLIGDYSTYSFGCLDDTTAITTEAEFVEAVSSFVCTLRSDLDAFTEETFVNYQDEVTVALEALQSPELTCTSAGITDADSFGSILEKICVKFDDLDTYLDISDVTWDSCFTVLGTPTNISTAFALVLDQICQVKESSSALPTVNNATSCLSITGNADSIVDTIDAIKTRLCQTPVINNADLSSTCVSIPESQTDVQTLLQSMLARLDELTSNMPSFDPGDFSVAAMDEEAPCSGLVVTLANSPNQDRLVAVNEDDANPATLIEKLVGVGMDIDATTNPEQITLTVTEVDDHTVLASSTDDTPGELDQKIKGQSDGIIEIQESYNSSTKQLDLTPSVDYEALATQLLNIIKASSTLQDLFCEVASQCPLGTSDCLSYEVFNETGSSVSVYWKDCASGGLIRTYLDDSSKLTICAQPDTVVAPGCTITLIGGCAGGELSSTTTTTTTTVFE
jgi:hypothetical protein